MVKPEPFAGGMTPVINPPFAKTVLDLVINPRDSLVAFQPTYHTSLGGGGHLFGRLDRHVFPQLGDLEMLTAVLQRRIRCRDGRAKTADVLLP